MENMRNGNVCVLLRKIGIPQHILGSKYIEEAIYLVIEHPSMLDGVTKVLYPTIAKIYETTPSRVERAIRHAIICLMNNCPAKIIQSIFGNTANWKITNSMLIATLAQVVKNEPNHVIWSM